MRGVTQLYALQTTAAIRLRMIDIPLLSVLHPLSVNAQTYSVSLGGELLSQMMPDTVLIFLVRN